MGSNIVKLFLLELFAAVNSFDIVKVIPEWILVSPGDQTSLVCGSDSHWEYCKWISPSGQDCDFEWKRVSNGVEKQECSLGSQVSFSGEYNNKECGINIISIQTGDHGIWTCLMEEYVFLGHKGSGSHAQRSVNVTVKTATTAWTTSTTTTTTTTTSTTRSLQQEVQTIAPLSPTQNLSLIPPILPNLPPMSTHLNNSPITQYFGEEKNPEVTTAITDEKDADDAVDDVVAMVSTDYQHVATASNDLVNKLLDDTRLVHTTEQQTESSSSIGFTANNEATSADPGDLSADKEASADDDDVPEATEAPAADTGDLSVDTDAPAPDTGDISAGIKASAAAPDKEASAAAAADVPSAATEAPATAAAMLVNPLTIKIVGIACSLVLVGSVLAGLFLVCRSRQRRQLENEAAVVVYDVAARAAMDQRPMVTDSGDSSSLRSSLDSSYFQNNNLDNIKMKTHQTLKY